MIGLVSWNWQLAGTLTWTQNEMNQLKCFTLNENLIIIFCANYEKGNNSFFQIASQEVLETLGLDFSGNFS